MIIHQNSSTLTHDVANLHLSREATIALHRLLIPQDQEPGLAESIVVTTDEFQEIAGIVIRSSDGLEYTPAFRAAEKNLGTLHLVSAHSTDPVFGAQKAPLVPAQ